MAQEDRMIRSLAIGLLLLAFAAPVFAEPRRRDTDAVRAVAEAQAPAWNAHDSRAYAALFTEDAQVVNVVGWRWSGRAELESKLGRAFQWVFADSTLTIESVDVSMLARDIAVAHVRWSMVGARSPTGLRSDAPERGIQLLVLKRQSGQWRIAHFQNTNAVPERDFPLGPPARAP
jgi:uncharacterized protein (TIGR02246 family)